MAVSYPGVPSDVGVHHWGANFNWSGFVRLLAQSALRKEIMLHSTSMREAFFKMNVPASKENGSIVKAAIQAAQRGAGERQVRDWNAHLKLRTYNALVKQDVM